MSSPATCAASGARVGQVLVEQRVHEREEQQRVGARADEVVLVGLARGARAPRVDDDDLAAARADRAQAPAHVGRREQAAVGGQRVGAEDEQVIGAVDVGHGDRRPAAEHERRGHLLGVLVDGAGAVEVARLQRLEHDAAVEQAAQVVGAGVADVGGDRVAAVLGLDGGQPAIDLGEGLVPRRRAQVAAGLADQRGAQAVGILVQLAQRGALGAHEAVAEDVVGVAADAGHRAVVDRDAAARTSPRTAGTC